MLAAPMGDDPLGWHFDGPFQDVRRRIARSQHLSIATALLGSRAMGQLGLRPTTPWYPVVKAPVNLVLGRLIRVAPPVRRAYVAHAHRKVDRFVASLSGSTTSRIGGTVEHLTR
jgi:hypothetical protein